MKHRRSTFVRSSLLAAVVGLVSCIAENGPTNIPGSDSPIDSIPLTPDSATAAWLSETVYTFETATVRDDRSDLTFLDSIVGDARVVSLGEATHGSRNFFLMKHRILDYLVREQGFTHFAIEATWPEMNRIDEWVQGGAGDPYVLLSGQYFWTWRVDAVLDLVLWARDYNANRGSAPAVHVLGFDMQAPGMAIYYIRTFLDQVAPDTSAWAVDKLTCIDPNDPAGAFAYYYGDRTQGYRDTCRGRVNEVYTLLDSNESAYVAAGGLAAYDRALHAARIIQQYDEMISGRRSFARDRAMAENVTWLLDQAGLNAKMVLWAHNAHVSDAEGWMGRFLRRDHGVDHVIFGFSFYEGRFTAVPISESGQFGGPWRDNRVEAPLDSAYSWFFRATGLPHFVLDLQGLPSVPESQWIEGPLPMRQIGCCYQESNPGAYFVPTRLPVEYDAIIYFETSFPTQLLAYLPPSDWEGNP